MIAFGCAVTDTATYERCALPGIRRVAEPDAVVMAHQSTDSLPRNYNLLLEKAAARSDLEALVLLHQDAEIVSEDFCQTVRAALSGPEVALVGCVGAIGVRNIDWWAGAVTWASFTHRYREYGGGEFPGLSWVSAEAPPYAELGEVDSIDGFVMALSPWAVRELRFDETVSRIHGYDFDFCRQARAAGKKVLTADFKVIHHHDLNLLRDREAWIEAHIRMAEKWDGSLPGASEQEADWRRRALRAEAELGAAKVEAASALYQRDALARAHEKTLSGLSWRLIAPLRKARALARRRRSK